MWALSTNYVNDIKLYILLFFNLIMNLTPLTKIFITCFKQEKETKIKLFIDNYNMLPKITGFMNYGQQILRVARYIDLGFMIILSHTNRLHVTIQYPYEKLITSECFRSQINT